MGSVDRNDVVQRTQNNPWRAVLLYAVFGFLWILFSDRILAFFVQDPQMYQSLQTYKGWFYVFITTILMYYLIRLESQRTRDLNSLIGEQNMELIAYAEETEAMDQALKDQLDQLNKLNEDAFLQKEYLDKVINNSNAAICIWRLDGTIVDCNAFYREMLGYGDEIIGMNWVEKTLREEDKGKFKMIKDNLEGHGKVTNQETINLTKDGRPIVVLWNDVKMVNPVTNEEVAVSFGIDVTKEREHEQTIHQMAYYDRLTGLKNRIYFEDEVNASIQSGRSFSLYYIDVDHFKNLNDIHGHYYGDRFLVLFGAMLEEQFEELEIFRWGGDEFIAIDYNTQLKDIPKLISRIVEVSSRTWLLDELEFRTTVSIGMVRFPDQGKDTATLFKNMEIALYKAKEKGRARAISFRESFSSEIKKNSLIESAIHNALAGDGFELNFQPIFELDTMRAIRLEVLLRFKRSREMNTNIGEVIAVAEKTGQIHRIDEWVIEQVFGSIATYQQNIPGIKISVNVSAQTFTAPDFLPFLKNITERHDFDFRDVEFEITEHTIVNNIEDSFRIMNEIKALGFKIALDDFGTRYSSLNYLSRLPFDVLKVDKSYVDNIMKKGNDYTIVRQIIAIAKELGLETVAEGIEEKEQAAALHDMGCDYGQGYYFSRPKAMEEIIKDYVV